MRGANNTYYNPAVSRSNNPYSNIFNENSDDSVGVPPYFLKILGPLAPILLSDDYNDPEELQNRLRIYSASLLGTSAFFWIWALYNTFQLRSSGGFDLGVVSFFGSGISSSLLLRSSLGGRFCDRNRRFGCFGKKTDRENDELDIYGRKSSRRDDALIHAPPGKYLRTFATLTQVAVVVNYMLGILFAFTAGTRVYVYFATYCFIFSLLWSIVAFFGWVIVGVYREAVRRAYGEEVLDGPSRPGMGLLQRVLIALTNQSQSAGYGAEVNNGYYQDEEDDMIDDELRALYEGRGGYTNA